MRRGGAVLATLPYAVAFTCYPEYSFSWCDNTSEASCIHNYAFSVGHFQRKLTAYYTQNLRPPLTEAVFLTRLPRPYQLEFVQGGCAAPLIMAYLLVAEAKIPMGDQDAYTYSGIAMQMVDELNELVKPILAETSVWPYREAIARLHATESATLEAQRTYPSLLGGPRGAISLEFAVVHCKEPLDWVEAELLGITPPGSQLTFYEKCGEEPRFSGAVMQHFVVSTRSCRDPVDGPRGDECLGYLAHIVNNYWNLATFTVFMQADPQEHLHFSYLHNVAKMISSATYAIPFLSLNGARHVRSWTPCLNAVHEAIFGEQMRDAVGPYCCAQFVVQDAKVRERPVEFYQRMLRLVDGTLEHDLCFPGKVKRSTHCYGMEFTWHLVFGEDYETPLRQDDQRLPLPLRLKFGNEFIRRQWNDVVLNPSTPKKIVEEVNYDQMTVR